MPTDTAGCPAHSVHPLPDRGEAAGVPAAPATDTTPCPCKVHRCVREKGLDHCGECGDFPCPKLGKMGDFRDLDTGRVKERTCRAVAAEGLPAWLAEYEEKADLLTVALERYNNGRMKRYLCELFLQQDLDPAADHGPGGGIGRSGFQGAGPGLPGAGGGDAGIVSGALNKEKATGAFAPVALMFAYSSSKAPVYS